MTKLQADELVEIFFLSIFTRVQVNMYHRSWLPVIGQGFYRQPLEKFAPPEEISLKRGYEQALPEPSGPAQKIVFSVGYQVMYVSGLVDIKPRVGPHLLEALHSDRIFHGLLRAFWISHFNSVLTYKRFRSNKGNKNNRLWQYMYARPPRKVCIKSVFPMKKSLSAIKIDVIEIKNGASARFL